MSLKYSFIGLVGVLAIPTTIALTGVFNYALPEGSKINSELAAKSPQGTSVKTEVKKCDKKTDPVSGLSIYEPSCK